MRGNYPLYVQLEAWIVRLYDLSNGVKKYLLDQRVTPESTLSVDQAIHLLKDLQALDLIRIQATRVLTYLRENPPTEPEDMAHSVETLSFEFKYIDTQFCEIYEEKALQVLKDFLSRSKHWRQLGGDGRIKIPAEPAKPQIMQHLLAKEASDLDPSIRRRLIWKKWIAPIVAKSERKRKLWTLGYDAVVNYRTFVHQEVKEKITTLVKAQYAKLMNQHQAYLNCLSVHEAALRDCQEDLKQLFNSIDMTEEQKRTALKTALIIGGATVATPAIFLLIDPVFLGLGKIIKKLIKHQGQVYLETNQENMLFQLTGLSRDKDDGKYTHAYKILASESYYESIERVKKYLDHKVNTVSAVKQLTNIMSDSTSLWGGFTPDEILKAQRIQLTNHAYFSNPAHKSFSPDHKDSLVAAMVAPFDAMIKQVFVPIQAQYGSQESLEKINKLLDKINFNENIAGPQAHNAHNSHVLVRSLSNECQIHHLVCYLVKKYRFFGATQFNQQLHHDHVVFKDPDPELGSSPDDGPCRSLVAGLLIRIARSDNAGLKKMLGLDRDLPVNYLVKHHPLTQYAITNYFSGLIYTYRNKALDNTFQKRQAMVKAIIEAYFNNDFGVTLQKTVIRYARLHDIDLEDDEALMPKQAWIPDRDIDAMVMNSTRPFVEMANKVFNIRTYDACFAKHYHVKEAVLSEAIKTKEKFKTSR